MHFHLQTYVAVDLGLIWARPKPSYSIIRSEKRKCKSGRVKKCYQFYIPKIIILGKLRLINQIQQAVNELGQAQVKLEIINVIEV